MKLYGTTDTHFGHEKLKTMGNGRPDDYEARILKSLRQTKGDILIHTGDISMGQDEAHLMRFMEAASGFRRKILVKGNHDGKTDGWYLERGFDHVCETMTLKMYGKRILFSHVPFKKDDVPQGFYKPDRNLHGHLHGNADRHGMAYAYDPAFHYDLAPDLHRYQVVNIESVVNRPLPKT